jgi:Tol biopolymer transport system component
MTALTEKDYNEHAFYTPDGEQIVWMSNAEGTYGGTDWWMMNADGSDKHRLTYFNEPDNDQSMGSAVWAGLGSFSPVGDRFIGGMQLSLTTQEGRIVMVELGH